MNYLGNAFSLATLPHHDDILILVKKIHFLDVPKDVVSVVGHEATCRMYSRMLNIPVEYNRATFRMTPEDVLYVGQWVGPRLPENATSLPDEEQLVWLRVTIEE